MKKTCYWIISILAIAIISPLIVINRFRLWDGFRNHFDGFATLISAGTVIAIYFMEQRNKKRDAARLVLKELEGVIPIAEDLADKSYYDQKRIAIATDNWPNQIHYFVKDMDQLEIDEINKIYSVGRYINKCIEKLDDYKWKQREKIYQEEIDKDKAPEMVINEPETRRRVAAADAVANIVISGAKQASEEIKNARSGRGYRKLRQLAGLE